MHHRPAAHSRAIAARHTVLVAVSAHWSGLSELETAILGRTGKERDGADGDCRNQRCGDQCPFHGKPRSGLVLNLKPPAMTTSLMASSIGYAVPAGTIPTDYP